MCQELDDESWGWMVTFPGGGVGDIDNADSQTALIVAFLIPPSFAGKDGEGEGYTHDLVYTKGLRKNSGQRINVRCDDSPCEDSPRVVFRLGGRSKRSLFGNRVTPCPIFLNAHIRTFGPSHDTLFAICQHQNSVCDCTLVHCCAMQMEALRVRTATVIGGERYDSIRLTLLAALNASKPFFGHEICGRQQVWRAGNEEGKSLS